MVGKQRNLQYKIKDNTNQLLKIYSSSKYVKVDNLTDLSDCITLFNDAVENYISETLPQNVILVEHYLLKLEEKIISGENTRINKDIKNVCELLSDITKQMNHL